MAHGYPDFGLTQGAVTTHGVRDLGELAVRLGSIVSFDRRGELVWFDDFEDTLNKWTTDFSGTGAAAAISTTRARNGAQSVKLTAGSSLSNRSRIEHKHALPVVSRLGFEFSWQMESVIDYLQAVMLVRRTPVLLQYIIRWTLNTETLAYVDSVSQLQTIVTGVSLAVADTQFHTFKLVIDEETQEFRHVIIDDVQYDLEGIPAVVSPTATQPEWEVSISAVGTEGNNDVVYVDDVILTQNEP
jgi:hypothetical protein